MRFLGRDRLEQASAVYSRVLSIHEMAFYGDKAGALDALAELVGLLPAEIIELDRVLLTQEQTAKALHATQRTLTPFIGVGKPAEQLNAANDIGHGPNS